MSPARTPAMIDGILHVHSTYSDGELSLTELRSALQGAGYSFACMADHAEAFDGGKLERYVADCAAHSDAGFLFLPGLEFECERRLHVIGYGCVQLAGTTDPQEVIAHIGRAGGLPVIAHPPDPAFEWLDSFAIRPHGLEVWNSKYDGRYAPRPATFDLLRRWRAAGAPVRAFYGVDLHWRRQFRGLGNRLYGATLSRDGILGALTEGRYAGLYQGMELPASGEVDLHWLARAGRRNRRSSTFRKSLKQAKRWLDRFGIRVPARLKTELRRWF